MARSKKYPAKRPRGRPIEFTAEKRKRFLKHLAANGVLGHSAEATGFSPDCIEDHRRKDEAFDKEVIAALTRYGDKVERTFLDQALNGRKKAVFYQGERCDDDEVVEYDTQLILTALRRHRPEYRERQAIDHTVKGGVMVVGAEQSVEEFLAGAERDRSRKS